MEDSNKKEVIQFGKGLYTDYSPQCSHREICINCYCETIGDVI